MNYSQDTPLIACVDDEESIRSTLEYALTREGYRVETHSDGDTAWERFAAALPDMAIIDIMMPGMDGLDLCRNIRKISEQIPIILLTSRDEEIDRVVGLELGADDYLCKPFSIRELVARIKVIFRRVGFGNGGGGVQEDTVVRGELALEPTRQRVTWKGSEITLTVTEFRILFALASTPGEAKSREQLLQAAYPEDLYVSDRSADSHIKRIRKKFSDIDPGFGAIESIYGLGYRYCLR